MMGNEQIKTLSKTLCWSEQDCFRAYYLLPQDKRNGANLVSLYIYCQSNNVDMAEGIRDIKTLLTK